MRAEAEAGNGEFEECREIHPHFCRVFGGRDRFFVPTSAAAREAREFSLAKANLAEWKDLAVRARAEPDSSSEVAACWAKTAPDRPARLEPRKLRR